MDDSEKKKINAVISELERIRGRHTELVSVYVPAGFNLAKVVNQLKQEQSTAQNIKSKTVRKNVSGALEKILQHLKLYKQTPEKGLAIFSGNVSDKEGVADIEIWSIEPPESIKVRMYRCDQSFILDPLRGMIKEKEIYGLIVLDKSEADIGLLKGKKIQGLKHMESIVPGKTKKGGWCIHEDTNIETNSHEPVRNMKGGDRLKAFDFKNKKIVNAVCKRIFSRKAERAYNIRTKNSDITVTPEHLFFVSLNEETKAAEYLKVDDFVLLFDGKNIKKERIISKKEIRKPKGLFYDMEIPEYQNFIANNIILHNSQARYARIREGLLNDFLKKVGEIASAQFKEYKDLKGIIIGGPGPIKEHFMDGDYLDYDIKKKILGVVNTSYTAEPGLKETVERSDELISQASVIKEKQLLERFFNEFAKDSGLAIYGLNEVMDALKAGNMELLLISEAFDWIKVKMRCPKCDKLVEKTIRQEQVDDFKCEECKSQMEIIEEKELEEKIIKTAEDMGTQIEIISVDTPKGEQLKELGGIAGILRYRKE